MSEDAQLHEYIIRDIDHYIDEVCRHLLSEQIFNSYVRKQLKADIIARVARRIKKEPNPSRAVYETLKERGAPQKVAEEFTGSRIKFTFPLSELLYIFFLSGIAAMSNTEDNEYSIMSKLILGAIVVLLPFVAYFLQRFAKLELVVHPDGILKRHFLKEKTFIPWSSINAVKSSSALFISKGVILQLANNKQLRLLPVSTNYAYIVSCVLNHVPPSTEVKPEVVLQLKKHIQTLSKKPIPDGRQQPSLFRKKTT